MTEEQQRIAAHDHFEHLIVEMKQLELLLEEMQHHKSGIKDVNKYEARRAMYEARACLEVAQYWMGKALNAAKAATNGDQEAEDEPRSS